MFVFMTVVIVFVLDPSTVSAGEKSTSRYRWIRNQFPLTDQRIFYPVRVGEVLNHRYQIVGKLGYGSSATVWLCRDLFGHGYVTITISTAAETSTVNQEFEIYNHLKTIRSHHAGLSCLRSLNVIFDIRNRVHHGVHNCLVHPPLGMSLDNLNRLLPGGVISSAMVRTTIRNILAALGYLHMEARVVHTDIQPNNILLGIKDESILEDFEQVELEAPVPRKALQDRTIYVSRPLPISYGTPVLCDLGEARIEIEHQKGDIMPHIYRAPEVILDMSWDYKVDIGNVGMLIWDLFEHHHLFHARDKNRKLNDEMHLTEMHAVLGKPPPEFLARSKGSFILWDEDGHWKGSVALPGHKFKTLEERLKGDE
ncbi:kinase-like domain-containing protein [Aspergillus stella-maris]|uniref:kinase-like domain-containing protein n=1 Tax=Aspergillus stella-maris TaxID=1810926 RepID=UPI003CCDA074